MIILGIDPGYAIVGYGVVDYRQHRFTPLEYGAIVTTPEQDFGDRLNTIYDRLTGILERLKPEAVAVEKLFFHTNQKTVISVAEARGVIHLAIQKSGIPLYEYTPLQVKTAVTGYGRAMKSQVMEMTRKLLSLREAPKPDDTADALAIAICHANTAGTALKQKILQGR